MSGKARARGADGTPKKDPQDLFLDGLRKGLSVQGAADGAGIGRRTAYNWRAEQPEFAAAWDEAIESGTDALEDALLRRALTIDTTAAIFLLKARRPAKYREVTRHEHTGKDGEPIRHTFDLTRLTDEELSELERISRRAANAE